MKKNGTAHNPIAIANCFVERGNYSLTIMQILKLSYIAHGFKLAICNKALSKELAQAWEYGPVFPAIYHEFKWQPTKEIRALGTGDNGKGIPITSNFSEEDIEIMNMVFDIYGSLNGTQLSTLTHKKGTPWHQSYYDADPAGKDFYGVSIPNSEIKKYYRNDVLKKNS